MPSRRETAPRTCRAEQCIAAIQYPDQQLEGLYESVFVLAVSSSASTGVSRATSARCDTPRIGFYKDRHVSTPLTIVKYCHSERNLVREEYLEERLAGVVTGLGVARHVPIKVSFRRTG